MGRIQIVYSPDANVSGRVNHPGKEVVDPRSGKVIKVKRQTPDDYLNVLKPVKGPKRLEFNPYLPKTLTPKGYAKLKLMMSIASKQYETLVKNTKAEGILWEDPDFPANQDSIGNVQDIGVQLEWKRPHEIISNAKFFSDGASRFDIKQGALGDCWLLAVVASISGYPQLFNQVVLKDQELKGPNYVGVIRFRFWRFGQWVEVLIDDRLPVRRGSNQLVFMHSSDPTEFWSALLEKAYAKLNGCYAHLSGGTQSEAMEDLTGGICLSIELNQNERPQDLIEQLKIYAQRCCLMGCSIDSTVIEQRLNNGLIAGHAYSLTGVYPVNYRGRTQWLMRLRNPWGDSHEWKGAWCDGAPQWREISQKEKENIHLNFTEDGEFWMSFEDFVTCFSRVEVCHLGLESLEFNQDFHGKRRLEEAIFSGQWQRNVNAGGCINNRTTYWTNPQFLITVEDPDPDDNDNKCSILVALMQKETRKKVGADFQPIGFMVYAVPDDQTTLMSRAQLLTKTPIAKSQFINTREVVAQFRVPPGRYVIIPSTFDPHIEANFILRVISQIPITEQELDEDNTNRGLPDDIIESLKLEDTLLDEDKEIEMRFMALRDPKTLAIDATKMGELLNNSTLQDMPSFKGFNKELCRSMVASVDNNLTGLVELDEFMDLWIQAKGWKHIFLKHDIDQSGYFDAYELREALNDAGFRVSNLLFNAIAHRYTDPGTDKISFEDFMLCMVRLKTAFETIEAHPKNLEGTSLFMKEDYLRFTVSI
ncbi:Calpain [Schistosoma japonicum]|nr:Calpain [Schistosoma japonicum]KAH8849745.1 Calpain [Schistosoma japonicum]